MTIIRMGKVHLVGAGPGDPELLTVKAASLLRAGDVVLHDDLVSGPILALAGPQAMVVNVGKRCGTKKITQLEINRLMVDSAQRGMTVIRLKSGDPAVFGRLGEEIDALAAAGVPFEVVPGVTAAIAAAASLGASLTDRRKSSRILIVSGHRAAPSTSGRGNETEFEEPYEQKIDWRAVVREGTTIAIYMPGHEFRSMRAELFDAGLPAETPAVVVSRASTPAEQQVRTTLAMLHTIPELPSPTILLIGKSLERVARATDVPAAAQSALDSILGAEGFEAVANAVAANRERSVTR
jgi:uroporphyrin-III C-methyltransferase